MDIFAPMDRHRQYMERCLELAKKAAEEGESAVGSIIVKEDRIVGEGYEMSRQLGDITRHAEMMAILDALKHARDISGAVLYSNVEPCILCAYAIRHYKIAEVVYCRLAGELGGTSLLTAEFNSWGTPPVIRLLPELC